MSARVHGDRDPETGLLNESGLEQALDSELSRAARHELPLALVLLQISGPLAYNGEQEQSSAIAKRVAGVIEARIRKEDRAARIGRLKFAVLAVQADESAALVSDLTERVRRALIGPGEDGLDHSVAVGAVDCQYDELSRDELFEQAEKALAAAMLTCGRVPSRLPAGSARLDRANGRA